MRNLLLLILISLSISASAQKKLVKPVVSMICKVDSAVQENCKTRHCDAWWNYAVLHIGNLEAFKITGDTSMLNFSTNWAETNKWMGASCDIVSKWQYDKPIKTPFHVLFADWQACFQIYLDLYKIKPDSNRIARAKFVMGEEVNRSESDFWYWMDALFMGMPVMTKLYNITGDSIYSEKMFEYFNNFDSKFWDKDAHLYYRDKNYVYPDHKTRTLHNKDFWSRGNGWVISVFARVMSELPETDPHYNIYKERFLAMADTVRKLQCDEGYWNNCLSDSLFSQGKESSGTGLFLYAFCWGVNHKLLDRKQYAPVIQKAWNFLSTTCVQSDFSVGYVYDMPEERMHKYVPDPKSKPVYGTGIFLMAASEYVRYLRRK